MVSQKYDLPETKEPIPSTPTADEEDDPFALVDDFKVDGPPWSELDTAGKFKRVGVTVAKIVFLIGFLYLFICSLDFLSSAFRLLGGKTAGEAFSSNTIVSNPVAGLMIGVVATVLLQSSSTTTSIVVAMVAADIIDVKPAIPLIMGANIGTSVTNTIVSMGQLGERNQFRRAFAGATVHDMFNILSVVILLPLEEISHYLFYLTDAIIEDLDLKTDKSANKELLKKITKPFTKAVIELDKKVIEGIAKGDKSFDDKSLIKFWCDKGTTILVPTNITKQVNATSNSTGSWTMQNVTELVNKSVTVGQKECDFLFHDTGMTDAQVGGIMLVASLTILCICIYAIVKILHSLLRGQISKVIRRSVNSDFPKPFGFLTGYAAIIVGACMTILVQSSSIFTSALTPLIGLGVVSLDRAFPLTLGSNIGTTGTGILAALASSSDRLGLALQIALCHLFFNISGILIWYPVPFMRKVPLTMAKKLGNTTAEYRWFALVYIFLLFFITPAVIFAISLAGWKVFAGIMIPVAIFILVIIAINILQSKKPSWLPKKLRTWDWTPTWCHSLAPYDRIFVRVRGMCKKNDKEEEIEVGTISKTNKGYES